MIKRTLELTYGYFSWLKIRKKYKINDDSVVLCLANENEKIDYYALAHLNNYMDLKKVNKCIVFYENEKVHEIINSFKFEKDVVFVKSNGNRFKYMYQMYCFFEFSFNLVFTFISIPKDNLLQQLLLKTDIDEEEAVCLGLYILRKVTKLQNN